MIIFFIPLLMFFVRILKHKDPAQGCWGKSNVKWLAYNFLFTYMKVFYCVFLQLGFFLCESSAINITERKKYRKLWTHENVYLGDHSLR